MRIGILSAELDHESKEENEQLTTHIEEAGHEAVIVNYGDGYTYADINNGLLYARTEQGVVEPVKLDIIIPRVNETDIYSISLASFALQVLQSKGVFSIIEPAAIELAKNKARTLQVLQEKGLPVPRTIVPTAVQVNNTREILRAVEPDPRERRIIKSLYGTIGRGTKIADSEVSGMSFLDDLHEPNLVQAFVETPGLPEKASDIRIIIIGFEAVSAYRREVSTDKDFRTNVYREGTAISYDPTDEEKRLGVEGARALNLPVAGADVLQPPQGPVLGELNASLGFADPSYDTAQGIVTYSIETYEQTKSEGRI